MNIIFYTKDMTICGGAEKMFAIITSELAEKGNNIHLKSMFSGEYSFFKISNKVSLHKGAYKKTPNRYIGLFAIFKNIYDLSVLIRKVKPDYVVTDFCVIYMPLLVKFAIMLSRVKTKIIVWQHNSFIAPFTKKYKLMRKYMYRRVDHIVALTDHDVSCIQTITNKVRRIYNPVDSEKNNTEYNVNSKNIIIVGKLSIEKRMDHAIKAWSKISNELKNVKLLIIGGGYLEKELKGMAKDIDNIEFVGVVTDVSPYYKDAAFIVMPSLTEGLPLVLIEATANGLPIVSYNCSYGIPAVLEDNKNGLLIENGNIDKLAEGILKMYTDREFRIKCSEYTSIKIKEFDREHIIKQWMDLFSDLSKTENNN